MSGMQLSEVQYLNFVVLTLLRDAIARDPVLACTMFGLHADQVATLKPLLSPDRILATVANAGHECLLALRQDIVSLLESPLPLVGALSSVRPQAPLPLRCEPRVTSTR